MVFMRHTNILRIKKFGIPEFQGSLEGLCGGRGELEIILKTRLKGRVPELFLISFIHFTGFQVVIILFTHDTTTNLHRIIMSLFQIHMEGQFSM